MGFWIWWIKKEIFMLLVLLFCFSVSVSIALGFLVTPWFMVYPTIVVFLIIFLFVSTFIWKAIILPIKKYIKSEKEEYKNLEDR